MFKLYVQQFLEPSMISHQYKSFDPLTSSLNENQQTNRSLLLTRRMKFDFTLLTILSSHAVEPCHQFDNCLLSELDEPEHFEKWDCSEPILQE